MYRLPKYRWCDAHEAAHPEDWVPPRGEHCHLVGERHDTNEQAERAKAWISLNRTEGEREEPE